MNNFNGFNNLNKYNFFNSMEERYPEAMKKFNMWIDGYKESVEWEKLFNAGVIMNISRTKSPKFHHLPYELQVGILLRFMSEAIQDEGGNISEHDMRYLFETVMIGMEGK